MARLNYKGNRKIHKRKIRNLDKKHKKYSLASHGEQSILNSDIFSTSRFIKKGYLK